MNGETPKNSIQICNHLFYKDEEFRAIVDKIQRSGNWTMTQKLVRSAASRSWTAGQSKGFMSGYNDKAAHLEIQAISNEKRFGHLHEESKLAARLILFGFIAALGYSLIDGQNAGWTWGERGVTLALVAATINSLLKLSELSANKRRWLHEVAAAHIKD